MHIQDPVLNRNHYGNKKQYWYFRTSKVMAKYYANEPLNIDDKINIRSMNILPVHFISNIAVTCHLQDGKLALTDKAHWAFAD